MIKPKNANMVMFLILLSIIFLSNIIIVSLYMAFPSLSEHKNMWIVQIIGSISFFIVPSALYIGAKRLNFKDILYIKSLSFKNIVIIIALSLAMQPMLAFISALTSLFSPNEIQDTVLMYMKMPYYQVILTLAIVPAITEELAFRGIISKGYENAGIFLSLFIPSLYFGIMHFTITQLFYAVIAGIIFSYLVKITKSIWASILAHFVLNGTQVTISYIMSNLYSTEYVPEDTSTIFTNIMAVSIALFYFLLSIPFLILLFYIFNRANKVGVEKYKEHKKLIKIGEIQKEKSFTPFFFINIIVYILFSIIIKNI